MLKNDTTFVDNDSIKEITDSQFKDHDDISNYCNDKVIESNDFKSNYNDLSSNFFNRNHELNNIPYSKSKVCVFDLAKYILLKVGKISTMKLQKLVYYSQAWSLVWDEQPIFTESFEAWANGPVVPDLFFHLKGSYNVEFTDLSLGNEKKLNNNQKDTIDKVLEYYGNKSAQWLIELSHREAPWKHARIGIPDGERSNRKISLEDIAEYYSTL